MSQPIWKLIAQLGDVHPIDYGGYFVYEDETGVYAPEAEYLEAPEVEGGYWTAYRFSLERCTYENGVLSDNPSHPDFPAWFAQSESEMKERPQDTCYLSRVCDASGVPMVTLVNWLCSEYATKRARAYREIGVYHGFENLDGDPLTFRDRQDVADRYGECYAE